MDRGDASGLANAMSMAGKRKRGDSGNTESKDGKKKRDSKESSSSERAKKAKCDSDDSDLENGKLQPSSTKKIKSQMLDFIQKVRPKTILINNYLTTPLSLET